MSNRQLQQSLRNMIRSLSNNDIMSTLNTFELITNKKIQRFSRIISYKCYETTINHEGKRVNGYGRSEQESLDNCLKIFFEGLLEYETYFPIFIQTFKKQNGEKDDINPRSLENNKQKDLDEKVIEVKNEPPFRPETSLALSITENNTEPTFEAKDKLEIYNKNFGNISVIDDTQPSEGHINSQVHDMSLKQILEEVGDSPKKNSTNQKSSLSPNKGSSYSYRKSYTGCDMKENVKVNDANAIIDNSLANKQSFQPHPGLFQKKVLAEKNDITNRNSIYHADQNSSKKNDRNGLPPNQYDKEKPQKHENNMDNPSLANQHSMPVLERRSYAFSGTKYDEPCECRCSERLRQANQKIKILEENIKQLLQENKALRVQVDRFNASFTQPYVQSYQSQQYNSQQYLHQHPPQHHLQCPPQQNSQNQYLQHSPHKNPHPLQHHYYSNHPIPHHHHRLSSGSNSNKSHYDLNNFNIISETNTIKPRESVPISQKTYNTNTNLKYESYIPSKVERLSYLSQKTRSSSADINMKPIVESNHCENDIYKDVNKQHNHQKTYFMNDQYLNSNSKMLSRLPTESMSFGSVSYRPSYSENINHQHQNSNHHYDQRTRDEKSSSSANIFSNSSRINNENSHYLSSYYGSVNSRLTNNYDQKNHSSLYKK